MTRHICIALVTLAGGLGAATTQPATRTSATTAVSPSDLSGRATSLIREQKFLEAQTLLQQADRAYARIGKVTDPAQADIVYLSGVCALAQKDYAKAHQQFERVRSIKGSDRSFVLNDAKVDLAITTLHGVGLKALDAYLSSRSSTPDEEAIDLFGGGIDRGIHSGMNAKSMSWAIDDYVRFNAQLEQAHAGMHHWGQEWLNEEQFSAIEKQKESTQHAVDAAQTRLNSAQDELSRVRARYDAAAKEIASEQSTRRTYNKYYQQSRTVQANPNANRANPYEASLRDAKDTVSRRTSELTAAGASFPKPTWSVDLSPILPGDSASMPALAKDSATDTGAATPDTLADMLSKMVQEIGPAEGAPWTRLHTGLAQQWLTKNAKGKPVRFTGNYVNGALGNDGGIVIVCSLERLVIDRLTISPAKVTCRLAESENTKAAKLVAGQQATACGTVDEVSCKETSTGTQQVAIELYLSDVSLSADEKKE